MRQLTGPLIIEISENSRELIQIKRRKIAAKYQKKVINEKDSEHRHSFFSESSPFSNAHLTCLTTPRRSANSEAVGWER